MVHYKFNEAEIRSLWKRCKNKRYDIKSFKNRGCYVKYIIFGDKQNGGCATGKVVTRFTEGEVYHWPRLRHKSLAPLLDVIYIDERIAVYMSSYLPRTLRELIHDENFINDSQCFDRKKSFIEDVLLGLNYLHSKHLCLMNISDVNVFITQAENKAVIANFTCLSMFHNAHKHKRCAPLMYRAPELIAATTNAIFDPIPTDIWSVGVMIMEVFLNHMCPWGSVDYDSNRALDLSTKIDYEMLKIANRGFILTSNDVLDLKKFLSLFLDLNPKNRCSAKEASLKKFIQSTTFRIHIRKENMFKLSDSIVCEKLAVSSSNVNSYLPCQLKNKRSLSETDLRRRQSNLEISLPEVKPNDKHPNLKKNYFETHLDNPQFEITNSKIKSFDLKEFSELANANDLGTNIKITNESYDEKHKSVSKISTHNKTFFCNLNKKCRGQMDLDLKKELNKINLEVKPSEKVEDNKPESLNKYAQTTHVLSQLKLESNSSSKENICLRESFSDSKLMLPTKSLASNVFTTIQMSAPSHCPFSSTKSRIFSKINDTKNNHRQQLESPEFPHKEKTVPHALGSTKSGLKENTVNISTTPKQINKNISNVNRNSAKAVSLLKNGNTDENLYPQELGRNKMVNTNDTWNTFAWQNNIMTSTKPFSPNHPKNNQWDQFNKMQVPDVHPQKKVVLYTTGSPKSVTKENPILNISPFTDIVSREINSFGRKNVTELIILNNKNLNSRSNLRDQDKHNNKTVSTINSLSEDAWSLTPKLSPPSSYKGEIFVKALDELDNPVHPNTYETKSLTVCDFQLNSNQEDVKYSNKAVFAEKSPTDSVINYVQNFVEKPPAKQLKATRHKAKCSRHRRRRLRSRKSEKRNVTTISDNRDKLSSKQKCQMSKFLLTNVNEDLNDDENEFETDSIVDLSSRSAILKSLKEKSTKNDADSTTRKERKIKKFLCFG